MENLFVCLGLKVLVKKNKGYTIYMEKIFRFDKE